MLNDFVPFNNAFDAFCPSMAKNSRLDDVETIPAKLVELAHNIARLNVIVRNFIIAPFNR